MRYIFSVGDGNKMYSHYFGYLLILGLFPVDFEDASDSTSDVLAYGYVD